MQVLLMLNDFKTHGMNADHVQHASKKKKHIFVNFTFNMIIATVLRKSMSISPIRLILDYLHVITHPNVSLSPFQWDNLE